MSSTAEAIRAGRTGVIEVPRIVSFEVIEVEVPRRTSDAIPVGSRICVTCYCPFRGLRGTVLNVSLLEASSDEYQPDEPYAVYLVQLDGVLRDPIEIQSVDIEVFTPVVAMR